MKDYLSKGGGGYDMFIGCPYIREFSHCLDTLSLILRFFKSSDVQNVEKE